jgi:hypothetical protein
MQGGMRGGEELASRSDVKDSLTSVKEFLTSDRGKLSESLRACAGKKLSRATEKLRSDAAA